MNRIKKSKWIIGILLIAMLLIPAACGKSVPGQESGEEEKDGATVQGTEETQDGSEDEITLHWEFPFWYYASGTFDATYGETWEADYTSEEWEDGVCLNFWVMLDDLMEQHIPLIEDELNHRLYLAGYDFYVHFQRPTYEEMFGRNPLGATNTEELVTEKRQEGMVIDLWVTRDYLSVVQSGEVLELTDFLQSEEGSSLYTNFDACVWENVVLEEGRIYGIPMNPIATRRCVYQYTPQLTEQLSIDMSSFSGDPGEFEDRFPELLQRGVLPLELDGAITDKLLLSMFGLENYGGIIAIRHDGDDWEAVDLWEEEEAIAFYTRLGEWKEQGYVGYNSVLLQELRSKGVPVSKEDDSSRYPYKLFQLYETDETSRYAGLNYTDEKGGNVASRYYVPEQPAYISEREILMYYGTAVISAQTEHPQECMQFLQILFTDPDIRLLLYQGVEGYSYIWEDDVLLNASAYGFPMGLGLEEDLRFWPAGDWGAHYAAEAADMNRGVSAGLGMTVPYDLSENPELSDQEASCRQIIEDNSAVFLGYYGNETAEKLEEVHEQLVEAGYLELIEAVNAEHRSE
ncbi:MAG: hypothetical protein HDQ98_10170 [Lachnospiraceae bacterium]|nr:hypothetical protein [Lachnospiraceae bacterium]